VGLSLTTPTSNVTVPANDIGQPFYLTFAFGFASLDIDDRFYLLRVVFVAQTLEIYTPNSSQSLKRAKLECIVSV